MGGDRQSAGQPAIARFGTVIYGMDDLVGQWVAKRIPGYQHSPEGRALGIARGAEMVAGVIYERWNGVHCEVAIAAEPSSRWATRRNLFALFYYPFGTLGCEAITVTVPASNIESLNLATKLGFEPEAIIKFAAHDGSALVVLKQYREKCRWLSYGQEGRQSAGAAGSAGNGAGRSPVQPA